MYKITITYADRRKTEFVSVKNYSMDKICMAFDITDKIRYYVPYINVLEIRVEEI